MKRNQITQLIQAHANRIFVVHFVKRTNGDLRRMVAVYYPAYLDTVTYRFKPLSKGLLPVWDTEKGEPRFINLDGVQLLNIAGKTHDFRAPISDRPPVPPKRENEQREAQGRTFEEVQREIDRLF